MAELVRFSVAGDRSVLVEIPLPDGGLVPAGGKRNRIVEATSSFSEHLDTIRDAMEEALDKFPGGRANALLKNWRILRKLRCCPWLAPARQSHPRLGDPLRVTRMKKGSLTFVISCAKLSIGVCILPAIGSVHLAM
jgi:hypothetical protein